MIIDTTLSSAELILNIFDGSVEDFLSDPIKLARILILAKHSLSATEYYEVVEGLKRAGYMP